MSSATGNPEIDREIDRGVDAVIFDFGGVLSVGVSRMMQGAEKQNSGGVDYLGLVLGPREVDTDHPFHRLERGEVSLEECNAGIAALAAEMGLEHAPAIPPSEAMLENLSPATGMIAAAGTIRAAGLGTAILTNNLEEYAPWRAAWNADSLVDVVVESWQVGMRKPAAEIFELTLDRLGGVPADRAIFLDDFPWNIAGAEATGLQTIHVTDQDAAAAELLTRLGL